MRACRLQSVTVLLLWLGLVGGALYLPSPQLLFVSAAFLLIAFVAAYGQVRRILFRSRWLMISLIGMFVWLTPGTPIPWTAGATFEGARFAGDQLARLLLSIAAVAVLVRVLDSSRLVAGLRDLAAPLAVMGINRDRLAVRLALTLDRIDRGDPDFSGVVAALRGGIADNALVGKAAKQIEISSSGLGRPDVAAIALACLLILAGWMFL